MRTLRDKSRTEFSVSHPLPNPHGSTVDACGVKRRVAGVGKQRSNAAQESEEQLRARFGTPPAPPAAPPQPASPAPTPRPSPRPPRPPHPRPRPRRRPPRPPPPRRGPLAATRRPPPPPSGAASPVWEMPLCPVRDNPTTTARSLSHGTCGVASHQQKRRHKSDAVRAE